MRSEERKIEEQLIFLGELEMLAATVDVEVLDGLEFIAADLSVDPEDLGVLESIIAFRRGTAEPK